ncbi:alphaN-acetylglucosamine transferase [Scheffersomyces stipitis CBS 6054]|uniref:AlphaN-acetylglucosamine transferase n=1 Tax=Scheffersomyces stipitis (strain ATCC 58785 / CBS 6054 / NBRC 10063 / NRRL Y-11545) TaxID=322104 RepID=A3LT00_PICST|nr:alphaN-acetylglucosamine transferase [Scheffersomyces stipitis CBS 6054]ABN66322.2 alphaN-acetylglucosamine transferase [Scheffersomyces stipitis CBS 6054]
MVNFGALKRQAVRYLRRNWEYKAAVFVLLYYLVSYVVLETSHSIRERGLSQKLRVIPNEVINYYDSTTLLDEGDRKNDKLAYMQYATSYEHLNLAIINFISIRKSDTKAKDLVVLYSDILAHSDSDTWNKLLIIANNHDITLKAVPLLEASGDESTWSSSFTKLHVFNQVEYDRIVYFDSDSMVINVPRSGDVEISHIHNNYGNLDELFKLPKHITYALPQAFWLNKVVEDKKHTKFRGKVEIPEKKRYNLRMKKLVSDISRESLPERAFQLLPSLIYEQHFFDNHDDFFANHVMVIKPSRQTFNELMRYVYNPWYWYIFCRSSLRQKHDYDMEIMNKYLNDQLLSRRDVHVGILPHKVYGVLTGEFREPWHRRFVVEPQYLPFTKKKSNDGWNALDVFQNVKLVHFSDSPIPKPWEKNDYSASYNSLRIYCRAGDLVKYFKIDDIHKPRMVDDCDSVDIWNWYRDEFERARAGNWVVPEEVEYEW